MNMHKELKEQATGILKTVKINGLRGVIACWMESTETLNIVYYFNGMPSEEQIEEASVTTTYILAALPINRVNEEFLQIDYPNPLPESDFWVFRN